MTDYDFLICKVHDGTYLFQSKDEQGQIEQEEFSEFGYLVLHYMETYRTRKLSGNPQNKLGMAGLKGSEQDALASIKQLSDEIVDLEKRLKNPSVAPDDPDLPF